MSFIFEQILELRKRYICPSRKVHLIQTDFEREKELRKSTKSSYDFTDAQFFIEHLYIELVRKAIDEGAKCSSCWETLIKYKYETINNCCIIICKTFRKIGESGFDLYGFCDYPTCNKLKFKARFTDKEKTTMNVVVLSNNTTNQEVKHIQDENGKALKRRRQLRGFERCLAKRDLQTTKAFPYRTKMVNDVGSLDAMELTGVNNIPSPATLRTAKSEQKTSLNRNEDPIIDLIMMKQENEDFIKFVSIPLSVELSYLPACSLHKNVKKHEVVYFDASGGLCGHPYTSLNKKRIKDNKTPLPEQKVFFYTTIAEHNKVLLPLQMLITEDHTAHNIAFHLKNFKIECKRNNIWPLFRKVVIDFSNALKIAINVAYNDFPATNTTNLYLKYCYDVVTGEKNMDSTFIVVQACCAHFARIVSHDLDRFAPGINKRTKHLIQELMAYASTTSDLKNQEKWWELFCLIFGSKNYTKEVSDSLRFCFELTQIEWNSEEYFVDKGYEMKMCPATTKEKVIFKESPFFNHFQAISDKLQPIINQNAPSANEFYVPGLIDHFLKKYMFDSCFWTNSMGRFIESGGKLIHFL